MIESSRIESWSDFTGTFTESLMDGQFAIPYWRPLQNLSIALDHALWGLEPLGYQLGNAAALAAAAVAVFLLARRLLGGCELPVGAALLGALAAGAAFALYPSWVEIVPVTSRRNHTLCALFTALYLWAQLSPRAVARPRVGPGLLALAALGSNEIGLVVAPLGCALVALRADGSLAARARQALVACSPAILATLAVLAIRQVVLGGIGGSESVSVANLDASKLRRFAAQVLVPQPGLERGGWWTAALLLSAALGGLALFLQARAVGWRASAARRAALPALVWLAAVTAPITIAGAARQGYAVHLAAALAVWLGCAAACGAAARTGLARASWLAWAPIAAVLAGFALHGPLLGPVEQWERGDRELARFLADLEERLPRAANGDVVRSLPVPVRALPPSGRRARPRVVVQSPAILGPLSIPSWVRLRWPERDIRVAFSNRPLPTEREGVLLVLDVDAED